MFDCTRGRKGPRSPTKSSENSGAATSWRQDGGDQDCQAWAQIDHAAEFQATLRDQSNPNARLRWYLTERERLQARIQTRPQTHEGDESCLIDIGPTQSLGHKAECLEITFGTDAETKDYNASSLGADLADRTQYLEETVGEPWVAGRTVDWWRPAETNVNSSDARTHDILTSKDPLPEAITLAEVISITMEMKQQIFKLQGEVSEQTERLASMDQLQDQVIKLQDEVLEHEKQLAFGAPVQWHCDAAAPIVQDQSPSETTAVPASLTTPRHRLGQMFNRTSSPVAGAMLRTPLRSSSLERSVSPSRRLCQIFGSSPPCRDANGTPHSPTPRNSPDRSNSPSRRLCQMVSSGITHSILGDLGTLTGTHNPSRGFSPERSDSPTRRIVARLAPRLLSTITGCVDGQIQRLESRLVSMEKSFENKQSAVPDAAVDGLPKHPLQTPADRIVAKSRASATLTPHDLQILLCPSPEDLPSCTPSAEVNMAKHQSCLVTPGKKAGSWKHFFRSPKSGS